MLKLIFVALLSAVGTLPAISQKGTGQTANRPPSPAVPPSSSCRLTIASLKQVTGSLVYRRLKYEVAALKLGQEPGESLNRTNEDIQKADNITNLPSSMIQSTDEGKDNCNCAAYIILTAPTDADDKVFMAGLAEAYKTERWVLTDLAATRKKSCCGVDKQRIPKVDDGDICLQQPGATSSLTRQQRNSMCSNNSCSGCQGSRSPSIP